MAELKTKKNDADVSTFLNTIESEQKREDAIAILNIMKKATGLEPKMWGPSIIGFDEYHYKYDSGHEADMCLIGFSPRKQNLTLYITDSPEEHATLFNALGKYKTSKACLYINRLKDVNVDVLEKLINACYQSAKKKWK